MALDEVSVGAGRGSESTIGGSRLRSNMKAAGKSAASDVERVKHSILQTYRQRTPGSADHYSRGSKALAGGTTGNLRYFPPYPLYFASASGSEIVDVDGNHYVDCFLGNGPLLLGHRHPAIVASIRRYEAMGSLLVNPPLAVDLAEMIQQVVPCAERVRFLNSGTEAVLTAARFARAFTGRTKIIKFLGHYHGQDDAFLIGLDPSGMAFGAGIPREAFANTILCRYGDINALVELLDREADVAAVILDPAMHAGGLWGSSTAYLQAVRDLTKKHNVLLIFDEVITGFRLALGGAQAVHGVTPDLATLGKAVGAGEKLAAIVGREEILRSVDPERPAGTPVVFQSGTGNDGTVALAAAYAAVSLYREFESQGEYVRLTAHAARLATGLRHAFKNRAVPCHVNQLGPMLQLFLTDAQPSFEAFSKVPTGSLELFYLALINTGILLSLPTSNHVYLSFAHIDADIDRILDQVAVVLDTYDFGALVRAESH